MAPELSDEFQGTDRFRVEARLGAGGMGIVYRAFDREHERRVALKTLREVDAAAIYRLKREFRALADLRHRNLVALHELVSVGNQWFFTMELVEGTDLLTWISGAPPAAGPPATARESNDFAREPTRPALAPLPVAGAGAGSEQLQRLRAGFAQLAAGLAALHDAGKLHRDVKPSNCLVTREGRAVLLDFGLVAELERDVQQQSTEHHIVGTAAYMSPEQAASLPLGPASDWYSVGVMLYEALTGRLPFEGRTLEVLMAKQRVAPPAPRTVAAGVPEDLDSLCVALLRLKPEERPTAGEVLRRLGADAAAARPISSPPTMVTHNVPFLGREHELAALRDAFVASTRHAVTVFVHGSSGLGKTALCRRFLDNVTAAEEAVVLTGRCYEAESLPFKAIDSLVDALSRYLTRLPRLEAEAVMPRDVLLLARIFPVLRRVEAVANHRGRALEVPNPQELRRRAFAALRELFGRLADRRPLVLAIDNLQWGDLDSAVLLAEVLRPPDPPPLLLLGSFRSEDADTSPLLAELRRQEREARTGFVDVRTIGLEPLSPYDTRALALTLLGEEDTAAQAHADAIATESHGNPYFLIELVRSVQAGGREERGSAAGPITLDEVLRARVARLPADARRLLEVIATAGRPVPQAVVGAAAELREDPHAALRTLRAANLVHTRGAHDHDAVECYHDRIRAAVVGGLDEERLRDHHRRLAMQLSASGQADPEALVVHYRGAGDLEQAGHYAAVAAARAAEALAFDRAATHYRLALSLRPDDDPERHGLRVALGDALANAGWGAEAAEVYREALPGANAAQRLELQRRVAELLLKSGRIDEGLAAVRSVLAAVGMRLPSPRTALLQLGWLRLHVRLRGARFRERDPSQIAPESLTRTDVCWSMNTGLAFVDPIRGAIFQARHQLLALRLGEPGRIAQALAAEVCYLSLAGSPVQARTVQLLRRAQELAQRLGDPMSQAMCELGATMNGYLLGRWREARDQSRRTEQTLRERCSGAFSVWQLANVQLVNLWARTLLGDVRDLPAERARLLTEAEQRGDVYLSTNLKTGTANFCFLASGDPDGARQAANEADSQWTRQGYHFQHYDHLYALGQVDLYTGDGRAAWRRLRAGWSLIRRSHLLTAQLIRVEVRFLRARAALSAAQALGAGSERDEMLREAAADARRLAREDVPWVRPLVEVVRGGVARLRGDHEAALAHVAAAVAGFDQADMALHAAAARDRRGALTGGDAGRKDRDDAARLMRAERVADPAAMTALLAPGYPD